MMNYVCHQRTRTKALRDRIVKELRKKSDQNALRMAEIFEKHWWYFGFMFGTNLGSDHISNIDNYSCSLYINKTCLEFITSDMPVVNIHPEPTVKMIDYYPLSPTKALIISNTKKYPAYYEIKDKTEVDALNRHIIDMTYENVFARSQEII